MKTYIHSHYITRFSFGLALALAVWSPAQAQPTEPVAAKKMAMDMKMMESCAKMKEQKETLMTDMKAQDAQLAEQVAAMNSAPDDKKLSLLSAVVTRMVEQRTVMNARMGKMQDEMMSHMMEHMQMGKDSMSQCPMMKGMSNMNGKTEEAHSGHHEEMK